MSGKPHIRNDLTGQRFGKLVVLDVGKYTRRERPGKTTIHRRYWLCQCDCGNEAEVQTGSLTSGNTRTCGCSSADRLDGFRRTHGLSGTYRYEYNAWSHMRHRCHNPLDIEYKNYGGRGIVVCERWRDDFPTFLADMGPRPKNTTLDRMNNDAGYTPENCRWISLRENLRNMRKTRFLTFEGRTQSFMAWVEELGIKYITLYTRIYQRHWDIERALSTPFPPRQPGKVI